MVGIVIVSHSAPLAAAIQELAQQMVQGSVSLAIAAGIDDPEHPFGTDAMQIYQAIDSVYSDDGVVVLMDLGSAVLSAEMALEFLPETQQAKVRLCAAPLVEGTIAAVVQAAAGASIEQVITEAQGALAAKTTHLSGDLAAVSANHFHQDAEPPKQEIRLTVQNPTGLHARPAAKFVEIASQFQADITLRNITANRQAANAKSINQVMALGIRQGQEIAIAAKGIDATAALNSLQGLVASNFGEIAESLPTPQRVWSQPVGDAEDQGDKGESSLPPTTDEHTPPQQTNLSVLANQPITYPLPPWPGIPASPGIAIGPVVLYQPAVPEVREQLLDNPHRAWEQLQVALETAREQIQSLRQNVTACGQEEVAIFDAHLLILEDPTVLEVTHQLIFDESLCAAAAWYRAVERAVRACEALEDPYLRARAVDISDVGQRVLQLLTGTATTSVEWSEPAILIAADLTPSTTVELDRTKVLGICTVVGSATSHAAILARSLGIPVVMGLGESLWDLENGTLIALDGHTGQVWVQPDEAKLQELQHQRDSQLGTMRALQDLAREPAITRDGHQVKIMANIGGLTDAQRGIDNGAEGVGLLRSEFLYLQQPKAPTEEQQVEVYQEIARCIAPHPLIIRTLDVGGDKPLPYLNLPPEANPFLGCRGIRLLLDCPELLTVQLRAILRASYAHTIKIMFPMVASIREIRAAKEILATVKAELAQSGIPFDEGMKVGIMIEVPAAVTIADQLAAEVDFFSIGTNDLSQYLMAADRNNPKVASLTDAFTPAALRMIAQTVQAAREAGIGVGVCGELASVPAAVPILIGLGVQELSMNPPAIPAVKAAIGNLTMVEAEAIASTVLKLDSAAAVRHYCTVQN